ncbi:Beta-glucan synthesis-associated protein SKN1 [Grifola frondosa]|uniref:Beta-glucan synthesis-associated protein SKN1 n=1 Tax=Grifola frondosa TaxID=5627 RepID=A0A1C7MS43_GRIFR|nr:Beta-glucan synthesis-associated protein SKN1 [Grifola frondosa]
MASLDYDAENRYYPSAVPSSSQLLLPRDQDDVKPVFVQPPSVRSTVASSLLSIYSTTVPPSISDIYVLPLDPAAMGSNLSLSDPENDDILHNPDFQRDRKYDRGGTILTARGLMNLGCLMVLVVGISMLFAGYPLITYLTRHTQTNQGGPRDPPSARTKADRITEKQWELVFSDEFNTEGRSFYPGDDPYWEAVDLHYWETNNLEWYDPEAITTRNGSLEIVLSQKETHNLTYQGGMMSTWNKFCFTGGLVEASVMLPGFHNIAGLWPAIWTMGNLGRAGYGASLEGMWPYTYDSCDVGALPNQTLGGSPIAATINGDKSNGGVLSYLPGQKLSRCTCPGQSHPGPMHDDGTYVGRSAPEIDIFEAQISNNLGAVSQSGQWGPFNAGYNWFNTSANLQIPNTTISELNSYKGGVYQQATSVVTQTDQTAYEFSGGQYSTYGIQYQPGFDGAYIAWIAGDQVTWILQQAGMGPDTLVEIASRPVPQEPLYLIMNLGMSKNFGFVDFDHLKFPSTLRVDYIRVYQDPDNINIGCDPPDFPTQTYINQYMEAYTNPLLTTWRDDFKQPFPRINCSTNVELALVAVKLTYVIYCFATQ